ncbi:MAG: LysR family transcriptional regulator [Clostridium sp.]|nr:LysR family transcriptional regulator [Clostridium sp.]
MYSPYLATFIQVADCGSFSKAAEKMFVTPASVMKQMNALENRVGVKLLERTNRGILLTKAGQSIYSDGKRIIAESEEAVRRARKAAGSRQYIIRVGTSLLNPCKTLIDLWGQITDEHPNFQLEIIPFQDDRTTILSTLSSLGRDFDLIIGSGGSKEWEQRMNFFPLGEYKICCAVSRQHPLAQKKTLEITDLYGENLMTIKRGDSAHIDRIRDLLEKEHPRIHLTDAPYFYDISVFNACEQQGSVLLTLEVWSEVHPSLVTIPVNWSYTAPFVLWYPKEPSQDILAFLEALRHYRNGRQRAE